MGKISMSRTPFATLATVVAAGMIATASALAQQGQGSAALPGREETVPFQLGAEQVRQLQLKLNQLGFSAGHVDGLWGPETSTAVLNFQQKSGLQATGKLDDETLRLLGLGAAVASPATAAQAVPSQATPAPAMPTPAPLAPASDAPQVATGGRAMDNTSSTGTAPNSPLPGLGLPAPASTSGVAPDTNSGGNAGSTAVDAHSNQAVATTSANAPQPAHGANSFTEAQARVRIANEGFQDVGGLSKDDADVWRGKATKNGQPVQVWLDYKGNVGQD